MSSIALTSDWYNICTLYYTPNIQPILSHLSFTSNIAGISINLGKAISEVIDH